MFTQRKGFTLIELMIVIATLAIIASIAIPNLLEARKSGNESAAIGALRTIATAQAMFREGDRDGDGLNYGTTLTELGRIDLIDDVLVTGEKQGYCFILFSRVSSTYHAHASPRLPGETGDRYFYVDESGVIRASTTPALPSSPPLGDGGTPPSESTDHRDGEPPACNRRAEGRTSSEVVPHALARAANRLARYIGGDLLDKALGASKSKNVQRSVLKAMDANHDGALTFEETLQTDVLGLARTLQGIISDPPKDRVLGKDRHITQVADWLLRKMRGSLRLGAGNETKLPSVPIEEMLGTPATPPLADNLQ